MKNIIFATAFFLVLAASSDANAQLEHRTAAQEQELQPDNFARVYFGARKAYEMNRGDTRVQLAELDALNAEIVRNARTSHWFDGAAFWLAQRFAGIDGRKGDAEAILKELIAKPGAYPIPKIVLTTSLCDLLIAQGRIGQASDALQAAWSDQLSDPEKKDVLGRLIALTRMTGEAASEIKYRRAYLKLDARRTAEFQEAIAGLALAISDYPLALEAAEEALRSVNPRSYRAAVLAMVRQRAQFGQTFDLQNSIAPRFELLNQLERLLPEMTGNDRELLRNFLAGQWANLLHSVDTIAWEARDQILDVGHESHPIAIEYKIVFEAASSFLVEQLPDSREEIDRFRSVADAHRRSARILGSIGDQESAKSAALVCLAIARDLSESQFAELDSLVSPKTTEQSDPVDYDPGDCPPVVDRPAKR